MHARRHLRGALVALAITPVAWGQVDLEPFEPAFPSPTDLESLEEGVGDADPLARGLRQLQIDLRAPVEFERVYRVPGRDDLLMRVQGGLYAVFPRSWYVASRTGPVASVPNDTVFHIGVPGAAWLDQWFPPRAPDYDASPVFVASPDARMGPSGRMELRLEHGLSLRDGPTLGDNRLQSRITPSTPAATQRRQADLLELLPPRPTETPVPDGVGPDATPLRASRLRDQMYRAARAAQAPTSS